jgi:hypothetical protein
MADKSKSSGVGYRPKNVTLLTLGVLLFVSIHLARIVQSVLLWSLLVKILPISPLYLVMSGLIWAVSGIIVIWGLWRGLYWVTWLIYLASLTYSIYYWIDRLWISSDPNLSNWPFMAGLNTICLLLIFGIMSRPTVRKFCSR